MTKKIIKTPSLKEQVYLYLKKGIVKGELVSGTVYSEKWAADLLGVSRTPVREAVLQLQQEYLVDILPYKGFQVKPLSIDDVKDTFQIRQALEGFCVIQIAQNVHDPLVQKLLDNLSAHLQTQAGLAQEGRVYEFMQEDEQYHRQIILYTRNERIISTYSEIRSRFERITVKVLEDPGRLADTVHEHQAIVKNLKAGLPWEAYRANQVHLDKTQKIMKSKMPAAEEG